MYQGYQRTTERLLLPCLLLAALSHSGCATSQHCAVESPQTCRMQGIQHQTGRGAVQDPKLAESYFRTGCLGGDSESCWELGLVLWSGESPQEAQKVFAYNCKNGHSKSCDFINDLDQKYESAFGEARSLVSSAIPSQTLTIGEAQAVFSEIEPAITKCFESSLVELTLYVKLRVDEGGRVGRLEFKHNAQDSDVGPFLECVRKPIEGLEFGPQLKAVWINNSYMFEIAQ